MIVRSLALVLAVTAFASCTQDTILVVEVVTDGLDEPVYVTSALDDPNRLFILEKRTGRIRICDNGQLLETPFLDIDDLVVNSGIERGLLGMAFHPNYAQNGFFFVFYIANNGDSVLARYRVSADPLVADPASGTIIFSLEQQTAIHKGGMIAFGPFDGYLYLSLGDGGSLVPNVNPQDISTPLASIIRIDVDSAEPYAVPPTNPFFGMEGVAQEIWAYGLRNPWRFSFDSETGDMYIGDVGLSAREEIDFQSADSSGGENYGWNLAEGFACPDGGTDCATAPGLTPPIYDYPHALSFASAVIGGYVYRGPQIEALQGRYLFADSPSFRMWTLQYDGETLQEVERVAVHTRQAGANETAPLNHGEISSYGQDAAGELYIVDRTQGRIYKIVDFLQEDSDG